VGSTPAQEVDKIRSEIDQIFSAEPFNPANQPRQDLGAEIILPEQEAKADEPIVSIDTSVQQNQAINSNLDPQPVAPLELVPIQATKTDRASVDEVFGSPTNQAGSEEPSAPSLGKPPEITLPLPPPPPNTKEPFSTSINFDPTKNPQT
jgi:hypothetical protein